MPEEIPKVSIEINFQRALEINDVGVRRASAFLKLGLIGLESEPLTDLTLPGGVVANFWPNPLPRESWTQITEEYIHWLTGSCLKEIDHYFSLFLDEVWRQLELVELAGKPIDSSAPLPIRSISDITNVATKATLVADRIGAIVHTQHFRSLSTARNALTHGMGRIRERDLGDDKKFQLGWRAFQAVIRDGDVEYNFGEEPFDTYQVQSKEGAQVEIRFVDRELTLELGEKVEITPQRLTEILMFYQMTGRLIVESAGKHAQDKLEIDEHD